MAGRVANPYERPGSPHLSSYLLAPRESAEASKANRVLGGRNTSMLRRLRNVKMTMTTVDIQSTIRHPLPPVRLCTTALTATPMRMRAPGMAARYGPTVRHASGRLSLALAIVPGATPSGTATSIWSANGTRTTSESAPPQFPPKPYIERFGTAVQFAVRPRRHRAHSPQEIWKGTTTSCPEWM